MSKCVNTQIFCIKALSNTILSKWKYIHHNHVVKFHIGSELLGKRNYYDVLEITPKSTKADIKKAYYKLSLIYHPDQNKGNERAAIKFREITEAYEVLGNVSTRRLYDKGFNLNQTFNPKAASDFSQTPSRKASSIYTGRDSIYNFDEWSKAHFETVFQRRREDKEYSRRATVERHNYDNEKKQKGTMFYLCVFIGLGFVMAGFSQATNADKKT